MSRPVLVILFALLSGCATDRELTETGQLPLSERGKPHHRTVDDIKRHYFTDKAYSFIREIPVVLGTTDKAYAAGTTRLSNVASFLTLTGVGRKVIAPAFRIRNWGVALFIHEYTHHLDSMDRGGEEEFIDHEEFAAAYRRLRMDSKHKALARQVTWYSTRYSWFYNKFLGIGPLSEEIAYVAGGLVTLGGPDYMWRAMRHILRRPTPK